MPNVMEFAKEFHKKNLTVDGFNRLLRQGNEFEVVVTCGDDEARRNMVRMSGPFATDKGMNDGNGFNNDWHTDGGSDVFAINGREAKGREISTSPYEGITYSQLKDEATRRIDLFKRATGGLFHGTRSSTHIHNTLAYVIEVENEGSYRPTTKAHKLVEDLPVDEMYEHIAKVLIAFMPVMKWVSMTSPNGARGSHDNEYDTLGDDCLYMWHNDQSSYDVRRMGRGSYFRIPDYENEWNVFHWENRMMDACASPEILAAWFSLNRAISMWAFDFVTNGYKFEPTQNEVFNSKDAMRSFGSSWKRVNKKYIETRWDEMKSYLTKYFKKSNSMDAIDILDKLIEKPVPAWLEEQNLDYGYDLTTVSKLFNTRNRQGDATLRNNYMDAIKGFKVAMADSLNDFHDNVASVLEIERKQAVSLYQMFKRENVDIEFMGGRLVYMGD